MGSTPDRYEPADAQPRDSHQIIVALNGLIGSGKNTAADYLVQDGFQAFSYAKALKDVVSVIFGYDREILEGTTQYARDARNEVDLFWAEKLGIPDWTPRLALQQIGTDVMRTHFHNDIWVNCLLKQIQGVPKVVVTDCRFPNELSALTDLGAHSVQLKRGPNPEWWILAEKYNLASVGDRRAIENLGLSPASFGIHPSEFSLAGYDFDTVIHNDGSLIDLSEKVDDVIRKVTKSPA